MKMAEMAEARPQISKQATLNSFQSWTETGHIGLAGLFESTPYSVRPLGPIGALWGLGQGVVSVETIGLELLAVPHLQDVAYRHHSFLAG